MGANRDAVSSQDNVQVEVKGPDPEVWGTEEERAARNAVPDISEQHPGVGEIWDEGTPEEIKGPGPEWENS